MLGDSDRVAVNMQIMFGSRRNVRRLTLPFVELYAVEGSLIR